MRCARNVSDQQSLDISTVYEIYIYIYIYKYACIYAYTYIQMQIASILSYFGKVVEINADS